jgi:ribonuclease Z
MTIHLLGTGAAVSDPHRTTTMLAVEPDAGDGFVLVDCGGDAAQRLMAAGLSPVDVAAVVLTHQHPDHISGFPLLIEKLWLLGRREPILVTGPADALGVARTVFEAYDTQRWEGLPAIDWRPVDLADAAPLLELDGLRVTCWPVAHAVPTIGLRIESDSGAVVGYSCDTAPCAATAALARGADLLIHEASGHLPGVHSSAEEAAETARAAGSRALVLVHLPPGMTDADLGAARAVFTNVRWGGEGERITVSAAPWQPRERPAGEPV